MSLNRIFLTATATLFCGMLIAGSPPGNGLDVGSGNNILTFQYGYTTFRAYALNEFVFGINPTQSFGTFTKFGSGSIEQMLVSRSGSFDAAFAVNFFVPQKFTIVPDSLRYQVGGWELLTSLYGFDILKAYRGIDLVIAPGVYWGSIRLKRFDKKYAFDRELYKNPFIAPMIRADLRFNLGPITLGGRFSWRYDISNPRWKNEDTVQHPGYKCEEMEYTAYIGYRLFWNDN